MIGVLFGINIVLALVIAFTTRMLQNHFSKLSKSVDIYLNPKAYKPESEIAFIRDLIEKYKYAYEAGENEHIEVETMIQNAFYKLRIGKFSYTTIQNMALKCKFIMWGILFIQVCIEILSNTPGKSISNFIFIIASTVLCIMIALMSILKNVVEQREQFFIKVQDFIVNIYPTQMKWKDKEKDVKALLSRIEALEAELEGYHMDNKDIQKETPIREEDIKMLLSKIDL